jgi:hypothetical protein
MERTLEVVIPEFKKLFEGSKDVIYYVIKISCGKTVWTVDKRYSDLEKFNQDIRTNHGDIPSFPAKSIWSLKKYEDIDARRQQLEAYLKVD